MPFEKFNGSSLFGAQSKIKKEAERIKKETEEAMKNVKALPEPVAPPEESPGKKPDQPFTYMPGQVFHVDNIKDITPIAATTCMMISSASSIAYNKFLEDIG